MKARYWTYHEGDLHYYRFSLYYWGRNMQTVYAFRFGNVLIDSAQHNSRANVRTALAGKYPEMIFVTHHHEDHTGNLAWIVKESGAVAMAHALAARKLTRGFTVSPLGRLISGSVEKVPVKAIETGRPVQAGKYEVIPVHTPGHTNDHMVYYVPSEGWLFSGDMYVADRIKYFESTEDIGLQMESLHKMVALDFDMLLCSHNPKIHDGKKRLIRKLDLMENFYGEVLRLYNQGMTDTEILKALGRKENYFYKFMTAGQFTSVNMVRSAIRSAKAAK